MIQEPASVSLFGLSGEHCVLDFADGRGEGLIEDAFHFGETASVVLVGAGGRQPFRQSVPLGPRLARLVWMILNPMQRAAGKPVIHAQMRGLLCDHAIPPMARRGRVTPYERSLKDQAEVQFCGNVEVGILESRLGLGGGLACLRYFAAVEKMRRSEKLKYVSVMSVWKRQTSAANGFDIVVPWPQGCDRCGARDRKRPPQIRPRSTRQKLVDSGAI